MDRSARGEGSHLPGADDEDATALDRPASASDRIDRDIAERSAPALLPGSSPSTGVERDAEEPLDRRIDARPSRGLERLAELVEDLVLGKDDGIAPDRDGHDMLNRVLAHEDPGAGR